MEVSKNVLDILNLPKNIKIWSRFYTSESSKQYLDYFMALSSLRQGKVQLFGSTFLTPRLEAFYGESGLSYSYSNQRFDALPFCEILVEIKAAVEFATQNTFNAVLVNCYRNGNDSNGWHADNEAELGEDPVIASLSFGASRKFHLKSNDGNQTVKLLLENGDLLLMGKGIQREWKHCVPKSPKVLDPRINLTFRNILK